MSYGGWQPYVPVAKRRAKAAREMNKLRKNGTTIEPIEIQGRKIARTFWGEAWCKHLERFSDFANRLPRGRTYVRNGSVCHLTIKPGKVEAIVSGSALYNVSINIASLSTRQVEKATQTMRRPDWLHTGTIAGTSLQPGHGHCDPPHQWALSPTRRNQAPL